MPSIQIFQRFLGAGALNTLVGYVVIFALMNLGWSPFASNGAGYAVGLTLSFVLNKRWVFESQQKPAAEAARFLVSFGIAYSTNVAALWLCLSAGILPIVGQVIGGGAYILTMFLLSNFWVFKREKE